MKVMDHSVLVIQAKDMNDPEAVRLHLKPRVNAAAERDLHAQGDALLESDEQVRVELFEFGRQLDLLRERVLTMAAPLIGIFWEVDGRLVSDTAPMDTAPVSNGIRDIDSAHFSFWPKWLLAQNNPMLPRAYDHYPRGRVLYREADRTFLIYADKCLLKAPRFVPKLCKALVLSPKLHVIEIHADEHYQCHQCNSFHLSD